MPLKQLANMSAPEPRLLTVQPFDKGAGPAIEKAIRDAGLGLNPSSDGGIIRVPIPQLTEERRKELVKHVHKLAEHHKVGVREARRDALAMVKDLEAEGGIPQDERRQAEKRIQGLTDEFVKKIDEITSQKEEEILQV
jgi:ribosome recycling factor